MSRPLWFVEIIKHYFPDRFAIADLTKKSKIFRKVIDYLLFDGDEIYYLPKDSLIENHLFNFSSLIPFDECCQEEDTLLMHDEFISSEIEYGDVDVLEKTSVSEIIIVGEDIERMIDVVLPSEVVKHFINQANYLWIMNRCICRDSNHCKEYPIDLGCIFLGEAVQGINPKLGRMATRDEALSHLQRASDLGLVHMIGRNKIDTQWMGIGPGFKLMSICNCCPCCCLYKVLPDLDISIRSKVTHMPGVEIVLNTELCIGCGQCMDVCIPNNLQMNGQIIEFGDICIGCGRCVEICPTHALQMEINDPEYIDKTIQSLTHVVDVT